MELRRRRTMVSLKDILRSNTRRHNSMADIHLKRPPPHNHLITAMGNRLLRRNSMAVITRLPHRRHSMVDILLQTKAHLRKAHLQDSTLDRG
jgi:hypothetical protein